MNTPLGPCPTLISAPLGYRPDETRFYTARATLLGRLASLEGHAPLLVHTDLTAGVYGLPDTAAARTRCREASIQLLQSVRDRAHGQLWLLEDDQDVDSVLPTAHRVAWRQSRRNGLRSGGWAQWVDLARRHRLLATHQLLDTLPRFLASGASWQSPGDLAGVVL